VFHDDRESRQGSGRFWRHLLRRRTEKEEQTVESQYNLAVAMFLISCVTVCVLLISILSGLLFCWPFMREDRKTEYSLQARGILLRNLGELYRETVV
jgi:hypothetical protein